MRFWLSIIMELLTVSYNVLWAVTVCSNVVWAVTVCYNVLYGWLCVFIGPASGKHLTIARLKKMYKLSPKSLHDQIQEKDFFHLGGLFGAWTKYAENPGLGLTDGERHTIMVDPNLVDNRWRMIKALKTWRELNPHLATFQNLIDQLLQLEEGVVVQKICKYLVSSCQVTSTIEKLEIKTEGEISPPYTLECWGVFTLISSL